MPETRRPVRRQARGLRRMEEILDSAEEVIAEAGYAEMTTNAVAARAGMSPGSLYQFFRNKDEILDALVSRFTDSRRESLLGHLTGDAVSTPLPELVGRIIDDAVAFKGVRPAYWALLHGSATGDRLAAASGRLHAAVAGDLAALLAVRAPRLGEDRRLTLATMTLATVKSVMPLIAAAPPGRAAELTAELKAMLVAYLSQALA